MDPEFDYARQRLRDNRPRITHNDTSIPGTCTVEYIHPDFPMPIGVMWYRHEVADRVAILNIYVHEEFRRMKVATRLLEFLVGAYTTTSEVVTGFVNELSEPWCVACGFKQLSPHNWVLPIDREPKEVGDGGSTSAQ